jgi:DNA invertase Pin-like site-specific DNA recombinase
MRRLRCAVYTRKSSEEGLEQDFNSLDAQREACEAYIKSQAELGWQVIKERYDDGGISGGTLERPALQRLLQAIEAKRIDIIVIYKIDRLTRSLTDFAKLAERFDELNVSFVSVTQQFNTATSMGRLMLNVLLSFAQFEREITGERIRDKIRASKQKGMWMGGMVPLGYDAEERVLRINPAEAKLVRYLYERYLELGTVTELYRAAKSEGLRTKKRVRADGTVTGNAIFSRGHLHRLLSNPIYRGDIVHKEKRYPGQHDPIIDEETWVQVQTLLETNRAGTRYRKAAQHTSLLTGLLFDATGDRYIPSHTSRKNKRYRYYYQQPSDDKEATQPHAAHRVPANQIEKPVRKTLLEFFRSSEQLIEAIGQKLPVDQIRRVIAAARQVGKRLEKASAAAWREEVTGVLDKVTLGTGRMRIQISRNGLLAKLGVPTGSLDSRNEFWAFEVPYKLRNRGRQLKILPEGITQASHSEPDPTLLKLLRRAHAWRQQLETGPPQTISDLAAANGVNASYFTRVLRIAYLAPDIIEAIVEGRQPPELTANKLVRVKNLPIDWASQREALGFSAA